MCYDADALPPVYGAPVTTAASARLILNSADGAGFAACHSRPGRASGVGVLVLPDNRGLSGFYERLTVRLAEQGHHALAIDYFGRTAGTEPRDPAAFPFMEHLGGLTREGLYADIAAGADRLRAEGCAAVVSLGFCFGGRMAFTSALPRFGLAGAIGLYGYPDVLFGADGPTQLAPELTAPILGMFGGGDEGIPAGTVAAFDAALTEAGVEHEIVTYPGAPHGFFELGMEEFAGACADAWSRTLAFLAERGRTTPDAE
ncbi:dienelactone hydrolase family protein [Microtetraspora niveoalba]|uniref:dienelactone hydrolase family protein n=1 Tax=Microtetraspora niveoalba TaxID=46175 RepID=UPI000834CFF2|nr:dienelactone hydrolase family protein [Microtetraspora niveoalba]